MPLAVINLLFSLVTCDAAGLGLSVFYVCLFDGLLVVEPAEQPANGEISGFTEVTEGDGCSLRVRLTAIGVAR
jgi:hypothetical protein